VGKRGRRARRREIAARPEPRSKQRPKDQQMARLDISSEEWHAFRSAAVLKERSVADYVGHLVRKELRRLRRGGEVLPAVHSLEIGGWSPAESGSCHTPSRYSGRTVMPWGG
jgi:hypothetical protein